ncbi:hypothetical protein HO173_001341 [Letharia columbiana]|uniref:Uncharacterized protein n=1 Tax=Letharia columbiana TaxID=112416 RepID=A0A8H6L9F6_9LECA|nr:uncharacterized protein HO173_001341 [Letharia columbiana]KAF6240669.1 hypothetical protein HO173_001341 [Letharia columbiana]
MLMVYARTYECSLPPRAEVLADGFDCEPILLATYGTAAGYTQEHSPATGAELTVQRPYELDEHEMRASDFGVTF